MTIPDKKKTKTGAPVILLMGATASGKTELAIELYKLLPIRIINVDSVQFYREFNIGSAKPSQAQQKDLNIRMLDIRNPDEPYSVASFYKDAQEEIKLAQQEAKIPLLTGGSMMYFKVLTQGLSEMPASQPEIRNQLLQEKDEKGIIALHQQLSMIDQQTASRLSPQDSQRIIRALEVYRISGKNISQWHKKTQTNHHNFLSFAMSHMSRAELHKKIEERFHQMLKAGFIAEVEQIKRRWPNALNKPAFHSVGYRQILEFLDQRYDYPTMIDKSLSATRQLAKRQITWLRSWPELHHLNSENKQELVNQVVTMINQ